ncbi:MAG: DUF4870 domain-containing protein [Verrucomicrobiota bacterium JB025]|nr:DUF4870 domain-containing protein [Verrucomicrobiota bacterium JB025]
MNDPNEGKVPGAPGTAAGGQIAPAQVAHVSAEQKEERNWALLAHVSSLSSFIGIPGFVGPLIVWLVKKDEMPFAAAQAKEALNFQISLFVYAIVCFGLILTVIGALIGIPGLFALVVGEIVFTIIASIKAGEGEPYRYPLTFRLIE